MKAIAHDLYRQATITEHEAGKELYFDFKNRVDPRKEVNFSFDDTVYFVICAALSGVVGNFAYDVIKKIIHHIRVKPKQKDPEEVFTKVIKLEKYEEIRVSIHKGNPSRTSAEEYLIKKIERRYRLIVGQYEKRK